MKRIFNYLRNKIHRWTASAPPMTQEQVDAWVQEKLAPFTERLDQAAADNEAAAAEHRVAAGDWCVKAAACEAEKKELRTLVNLGLVKMRARVDFYRARN